MTGSCSGSLRLWSVAGIPDMREQGTLSKGLTIEDEMVLGGALVSAAFDETMDMV